MRFFRLRKDATERGHTHYIRLKLHDVSQLFNSMDPSPFIEKDLDADAEEFIVSWAQEFPRDDPVRLHIYLEQWPAEDPKEPIKTAVHNYFAHRAEIADLEFKRLLEQGRISLVIGLVFLSTCLVLSKVLLGHVAADANLSLRLVACAPAQANLREAQSYAGGSGSERKELKGRKQRLEGRLGKGDSSAPTDVLSGCGRGAHLTSRRRCPGAGDCERRCSVLNGFFAGGCRAVQSLQFRQPLSYLTRVFGMRS